jgi:hypothetical protein
MDFNIDPKKNYERLSNGDVFTGQQVLNLLGLSNPEMQAIILLDVVPTEKPATRPESKYGVAAA